MSIKHWMDLFQRIEQAEDHAVVAMKMTGIERSEFCRWVREQIKNQ